MNLIEVVMTHLQRYKLPSILKWGCVNLMNSSSKFNLWANGSCLVSQNPRFYGRKRVLEPKDGEAKVSLAGRIEAQGALLDYLHSTRGLQFIDAENMSRNSPQFLESFLKNFENEENIGRSITRFLRYHPINEYEPFFESLGLSPNEYSPFLPRNQFFLDDDSLLLENYHVLCNYGIPRNRIGKIYKEASEVFGCDYGVLKSKLQSLEEMGLNKSTVVKVVASSPGLLIGIGKSEFFKVLEKLRTFGIEYDWIGGQLLEQHSYNWSHILELLCLLGQMGGSKVQVGGLICQHPEVLFECSGSVAISLVGFLLKFGTKASQIISMFLQLRETQLRKHVLNLRQCYYFLHEVEMDPHEIGKIVRSHSVLLGSCSLKKANSLLANLNTGKSRVCEIIIEDPQVLKSWVLGSRVKPLKPAEDDDVHTKRTKFLLDLGFVKNSNEMRKALKVFRGKAGELQERFDFLVDTGLSRQEVLAMIKIAPQILNMTKDVLGAKVDFLVNGLGYPVSTLTVFPAYVSYTIQRVNLRYSMYNWLVDQGAAEPNLALSTLIACSDEIFIRQYVNSHSRGPEIWEEFKKDIYSE